MKLNYTGPVKRSFGLQLKDGSRIRVQPGKAFTVDAENGRHVLRNWPELFEEVKEAQPRAEKASGAERASTPEKTIIAEKPAEPAEAPVEETE